MPKNLTREIAEYRSNLLALTEYRIELDVSEAQSDTAYFPVISKIFFTQLADGNFHLDFIGKSVDSVLIDGKETFFEYDGARITFSALEPGAHEIFVKAQGEYSSTGEGLHRFRDPLDGETYLYTQFEPADARRVFPNFEQPDLKAKFSISIIAPEAWTVLSNGAQIKTEQVNPNSLGNACKKVVFATTKPISTYLTAFIGGPYHKFNDVFSGADGEIALGYYCRKTLAQYFDFADINTITKQGLATFPKVFGQPYQWGKYDSVFVPEYNLGAMENPGCVTFNENKYIHRGHTTRAQAVTRGNTILHEMSHMWFGDLVTPKWWNDLWLKESFAEFMGAWELVQSTKYQEAWQAFTGARLTWALANDQYPTTHPILADVPDLEAADQVFDGITYAKGAAVLRQLVAWLGEETFFAGVRQYLALHAFSAATFADLITALTEVSGKDVASWAEQWLETAGVSTVVVERQENGVKLTQIGYDPKNDDKIKRPHLLKVSSWEKNDDGLLQRVKQVDVELETEVFIPWTCLGGADVTAILPNDSALSYLKIDFDEKSREAFLTHDLADPLSRAVVANALWQEVRDAKLRVEKYLEYVCFNANLADLELLAQLLNTAVQAVRKYLPLEHREKFANILLHTCFEQIQNFSERTDQGIIWRQNIALLAVFVPQSAQKLSELLQDINDQELRWAFLAALATMSAIADDVLEAELAKNNTAKDQVAYLNAVSSIPGTQEKTLVALLDPDAKYSNLEISALTAGFMRATTPAQARRAFPDFFNSLDKIWVDRSQEIAERIIYGIFPRTDISLNVEKSDLIVQNEANEWLANGSHENALVKIVLDCLDESYRDSLVQEYNL